MPKTSDTHFTNDELASIYDYVQGNITQAQLTREVKRTRTNTYYYLGRAMDYWLRNGVLQFTAIEKQEDLGGSDMDNQKVKEK